MSNLYYAYEYDTSKGRYKITVEYRLDHFNTYRQITEDRWRIWSVERWYVKKKEWIRVWDHEDPEYRDLPHRRQAGWVMKKYLGAVSKKLLQDALDRTWRAIKPSLHKVIHQAMVDDWEVDDWEESE